MQLFGVEIHWAQILGITLVIILLLALVMLIRHAWKDLKEFPRYRRTGDALDRSSPQVKTVEALVAAVLDEKTEKTSEVLTLLRENHEMIKSTSRRLEKMENHIETSLGVEEPTRRRQ